MNEVHLVGGITKDPELKKAASGVKYVQFTLAVNSGVKKVVTNYIDMVAFNQEAEKLASTAKRGTKLCIRGHLNQAQYIDQDGNTRNNLKVILEDFSIVTKKSSMPIEEVAASEEPDQQ